MPEGTDNPTAARAATPRPELKRLDALLGTWKSQGRTVPSPADPGVTIAGTDTYEWLGGGFFMVHRVDVRIGDEPVEAIEIIGDYDPSKGTYAMRSFDSQGNVATMQASVSDDGVWTFTDGRIRASDADHWRGRQHHGGQVGTVG